VGIRKLTLGVSLQIWQGSKHLRKVLRTGFRTVQRQLARLLPLLPSREYSAPVRLCTCVRHSTRLSVCLLAPLGFGPVPARLVAVRSCRPSL
jgi:hypothetical protein